MFSIKYEHCEIPTIAMGAGEYRPTHYELTRTVQYTNVSSSKLWEVDIFSSKLMLNICGTSKYHFVGNYVGLGYWRKRITVCQGNCDKEEDSGGQEWALNISLTPQIIKCDVFQRLGNGVDNPLVRNRWEHMCKHSGSNGLIIFR